MCGWMSRLELCWLIVVSPLSIYLLPGGNLWFHSLVATLSRSMVKSYNHLDIRRRLEILHPNVVAWKGTSDTESLLTAIECFGLEGTLQQSVGMFAFGLWDRQERKLYLARDRLGEKPLYFGWQNQVFMFSSELKAMTCHPSFEGVVDRGSVALFTRYGYIPAPRSIYEGIHKLTPGAYLGLAFGPTTCIGEIPESRRYWSLLKVIEKRYRSAIRG